MNEWEFTGDVNSWINEILGKTPISPIFRSKIEQTGVGSKKRRDLTLQDKSLRPLVTGEIKLPYQADGGSPYNTGVVQDARRKARRAGAKYFFTWNVNECVLWETEPSDISRLNQDYRSWRVTNVHNDSQLTHPVTSAEIADWLVKFLHALARIVDGSIQLGQKSPDEKFIEAIESSLSMPIQLVLQELISRYKMKRDRVRIDKWMREEQGWTLFDDPDAIKDNLTRASKFACYALVNKLVFHEALLKRYARRMAKLQVPSHIDRGEGLRLHLEKYFLDAVKITGDYETVFGETHHSVGNHIPFLADRAVPHWRALIEQIHEFDFSRLDYEVIGKLFERLISPEERHKYGQYYTKVEVVDLINSFSIHTGNEKVLDPACGGGTFLVRAYARMKELRPDLTHGELLKQLFGVDIMNFATHLTTINLAVKDLIDDENYPQVVRDDFFNVHPGKLFVTLPLKARTTVSGKSKQRDVRIDSLDVVIGNPPYIRQEEISQVVKSNGQSTKDYYQDLIRRESGARLSGRSDIHCYFWPHATTFLKSEGMLCFLTSSQWLDVEYGFKLQNWILRNFEIVAILESIDEPWFVGARVLTAITILKRQSREDKRMQNMVRFVQLRRPISEILQSDRTSSGAVHQADEFRDEIMSVKENTVNERFRLRVVNQGQLWNEGVKLAGVLSKSEETLPSEKLKCRLLR